MKRAKAGSQKAWAIDITIDLLLKKKMDDLPEMKNYGEAGHRAIRELIEDLKSKLPQ